MPMAASFAKWGATVSARLGLLRNAPMTRLRHTVHLPLTVGHPLWVIRVDIATSAFSSAIDDSRHYDLEPRACHYDWLHADRN